MQKHLPRPYLTSKAAYSKEANRAIALLFDLGRRARARGGPPRRSQNGAVSDEKGR